MVLLETALLTAQPEAELVFFRRDDAGFGFGGQLARIVVAGHGEAIVVVRRVLDTLAADPGCDAVGHTEEYVNLVEEVGAKIVDGGAGRAGCDFPAGACGRGDRAMSVEVCFEGGETTESIVAEGDQLGDGQEVGVEAAV